MSWPSWPNLRTFAGLVHDAFASSGEGEKGQLLDSRTGHAGKVRLVRLVTDHRAVLSVLDLRGAQGPSDPPLDSVAILACKLWALRPSASVRVCGLGLQIGR